MNRSYFSGSFWNAKYINDCANEDSDQNSYPQDIFYLCPTLQREKTQEMQRAIIKKNK